MVAFRMHCVATLAIAAALLFAGHSSALADEWVATKVRGHVFALNGDTWEQVARGDAISDTRIIRTAPDGRVEFRRARETVELAPNTQIRIFDHWQGDHTVIQEHFGTVRVEADHRDVKHFAVQTRTLVAAVKGTRFTVSSGGENAEVSVQRGKVEVTDTEHQLRVNVTLGQSAASGMNQTLSVAGWGTLEPVTRLLPNGKWVIFGNSAAPSMPSSDGNASKSSGSRGKSNSKAASHVSATAMAHANANAAF